MVRGPGIDAEAAPEAEPHSAAARNAGPICWSAIWRAAMPSASLPSIRHERQDFAEDFRDRSQCRGGRQVWPLVLASLRDGVSPGARPGEPQRRVERAHRGRHPLLLSGRLVRFHRPDAFAMADAAAECRRGHAGAHRRSARPGRPAAASQAGSFLPNASDWRHSAAFRRLRSPSRGREREEYASRPRGAALERPPPMAWSGPSRLLSRAGELSASC